MMESKLPINHHLPDFRVIIAGSRDFGDYALLREKCDAILSRKSRDHRIVVLSGTAHGADRLGERYAQERGYLLRRFPADWDRDGYAAGPIRNSKMAENADALIAFWDGHSRGTQDMIGKALSRGLSVRVINPAVEKLHKDTVRYAIEHVKGSGLHTGISWLRDSFNAYSDALSRSDGSSLPVFAAMQSNRALLAQRVFHDCCHELSADEQHRLQSVLDGIASDIRLDVGRLR